MAEIISLPRTLAGFRPSNDGRSKVERESTSDVGVDATNTATIHQFEDREAARRRGIREAFHISGLQAVGWYHDWYPFLDACITGNMTAEQASKAFDIIVEDIIKKRRLSDDK